MDSEHATRRRISACFGTSVHLSPMATILTISSSLANSQVAGILAEWDGADPEELNQAMERLVTSLTAEKEAVFQCVGREEIGRLLCRVSCSMVRERDFHVAMVLIHAIRLSLRETAGETDCGVEKRSRWLVYKVTVEFLIAYCHLEMEEYAVTVYSLRDIAKHNTIQAVLCFFKCIDSGAVFLSDMVHLLHIQLYLAAMFANIDLLHNCYIMVLYLQNLLVSILIRLKHMAISDAPANTSAATGMSARVKTVQLEEEKMGGINSTDNILLSALLNDIIVNTTGETANKDNVMPIDTILRNDQKQFVATLRAKLNANTLDCIADLTFVASEKDTERLMNLYAGIELLRGLVESRTGMVIRLGNVSIEDGPANAAHRHVCNFIDAIVQFTDTIIPEIGIACSVKQHWPAEKNAPRPDDEAVKELLAVFKVCSKGFGAEAHACSLLDPTIMKSVCATLCAYLILTPTKSNPDTIALGSLLDALSMLSTHCQYDLLIIYASLEFLHVFIAFNGSSFLMDDLPANTSGQQALVWDDVVSLPIRRVSSSMVGSREAYLNKVSEQVPKKSHTDDLDEWIEAIVETMCTLPRHAILASADLVAMMMGLIRQESLTVLRLNCQNDDRRLQLIKYLRYLWFLAQGYRDRVLCTHQRLQGYTYEAHTLPMVSSTFIQRERSFFPLQMVLMDMFVVSL